LRKCSFIFLVLSYLVLLRLGFTSPGTDANGEAPTMDPLPISVMVIRLLWEFAHLEITTTVQVLL